MMHMYPRRRLGTSEQPSREDLSLGEMRNMPNYRKIKSVNFHNYLAPGTQ